jgi:predicted SAM-dependent methyltransferase
LNHTHHKLKRIQRRLGRLANASGRKLQLGCGRKPLSGFVNLDVAALPGVDLVANLEQKLPFPDNHFDLVHARHTIEHVENLSHYS